MQLHRETREWRGEGWAVYAERGLTAAGVRVRMEDEMIGAIMVGAQRFGQRQRRGNLLDVSEARSLADTINLAAGWAAGPATVGPATGEPGTDSAEGAAAAMVRAMHAADRRAAERATP